LRRQAQQTLKSKSLHTILSLFFLTLFLFSQVGLSFFHHHVSGRKVLSSEIILTTDVPDCPVCSLHLTHDFSLVQNFYFVFVTVVFICLFFFLYKENDQVYFFSLRGRAPPAFL